MVKVQPVDNLPTASGLVTIDTSPLWTLTDPPVAGYASAREANGNQQVPPGSVVELCFIGYDDAGNPVYVFQYNFSQLGAELPIHDHRDVFNGGLAFSVYHPGTSLPQS